MLRRRVAEVVGDFDTALKSFEDRITGCAPRQRVVSLLTAMMRLAAFIHITRYQHESKQFAHVAQVQYGLRRTTDPALFAAHGHHNAGAPIATR